MQPFLKATKILCSGQSGKTKQNTPSPKKNQLPPCIFSWELEVASIRDSYKCYKVLQPLLVTPYSSGYCVRFSDPFPMNLIKSYLAAKDTPPSSISASYRVGRIPMEKADCPHASGEDICHSRIYTYTTPIPQ